MTQMEVGAFICNHLVQSGIDVVLSGGASVSFYTNNKYISKDLDFIRIDSSDRKKLKTAMAKIGFIEQNRYFRHPESVFIVEFPPGPPSVGDEPINSIVKKKFSTGILKVISPTDCVKDRLAGFYHFGDRQSFHQALLVVKNVHRVDLKEIERWSRTEGKISQFKEMLAALTVKSNRDF
jgi:hypothetical protein